MPIRRCLRLSLCLLPGLLLPGCRRASLPPPEIGIWYWHAPFKLTEEDREGLKQVGVTTLYVRAGTFASDGKNVALILPQRWESKPKDLGLVLTFNFHPGLVKHLEDLPVDRIAEDVSTCVERSWRSAGAKPLGVQFDVDCPTRLLPRYAEILTEIHRRLVAKSIGGSFSATALPTWLTSKNIETLAHAVDFLAPQFYEGRTGKTTLQVFPVSDPEGLRYGLRRIAKLGIPCQVGLATYGHALLFDNHQRLVSMYHGLSAEDALRHPSFKMESSQALTADGGEAQNPEAATGEDRLVLRAVRPDARGQGLGFRIAYVLPTPEMVTRQVAIFQAERPANVRGFILYRFPEPGESMSLPLESVLAGLRGEKPRISAKIQLKSRSIPWSLIDANSTKDRAPQELSVRFESTGNTPTRASKDAVQVLVSLDRPGVEGIAPGDFDEADAGTIDENGRFTKCAPIRADAVRFRRYHLLPGEVLRSGGILLPADGATQAWTRWVAQSPGGFQTFSSESSKVALDPKP